ncbi:hypothetical protein RH831_09150 [Halodesulfurarchaeum sp. HSR-GB]|uniref:hypothetical protein n=1 Tax=Halodesulfurarchaeum sp. HSR-GB TaxID=3074077 RepID=UPI002862AF2E|nr:hypothetical protein [Halodesulfurarchaeum sp. HSR-GB]MDR5657346.1 hypothetical protein [Halodesulfurarchaeum sp. HSR-GB]
MGMSFGIDSFTSEIGPFPDRRILDAGGKGPITPDPDAVAAPLIDIGDLKPGDFGEVTFSLHLCDNPGYVWANTMNVDWAENGATEPEGADEDETGPADEMGSTADGDSLEDAAVELPDTVQGSVFYDDDGNNLFDSETDTEIITGSLRDG